MQNLMIITVVCLGLVIGVYTPGFADGELNMLVWEGYADKSFVDQFEKESGCKVSATYVGSNDDFVPKLAAGGSVYDLISPSLDSMATLVIAGLVEPIDISRIPGWKNIYDRFKQVPDIKSDGKIWGVPFAWGSIPIMYRVDKFDTPPKSLNDLWDPKYKGKIALWDDKSAVYVASRAIGNPNIYELSNAELETAKQKLIEQKPLVRKYWATAGELVDLFANGEVWISNTWGGYQSSLLAEQGIEVREIIPIEGAEGWVDTLAIVKGTPNEACAYKFLEMALGEQGQCGVANVNGYSVVNPVAAKNCMSPEQFKKLHQDDPNYLNSLLLWKNLGPRIEAYTNIWNSVKATD